MLESYISQSLNRKEMQLRGPAYYWDLYLSQEIIYLKVLLLYCRYESRLRCWVLWFSLPAAFFHWWLSTFVIWIMLELINYSSVLLLSNLIQSINQIFYCLLYNRVDLFCPLLSVLMIDCAAFSTVLILVLFVMCEYYEAATLIIVCVSLKSLWYDHCHVRNANTFKRAPHWNQMMLHRCHQAHASCAPYRINEIICLSIFARGAV